MAAVTRRRPEPPRSNPPGSPPAYGWRRGRCSGPAAMAAEEVDGGRTHPRPARRYGCVSTYFSAFAGVGLACRVPVVTGTEFEALIRLISQRRPQERHRSRPASPPGRWTPSGSAGRRVPGQATNDAERLVLSLLFASTYWLRCDDAVRRTVRTRPRTEPGRRRRVGPRRRACSQRDHARYARALQAGVEQDRRAHQDRRRPAAACGGPAGRDPVSRPAPRELGCRPGPRRSRAVPQISTSHGRQWRSG